MREQPFDIKHEIDLLTDGGRLKTWSVVITILGDLLVAPSDCINGRTLAALVEPMGISDQALRVAIHRLKKDGWVNSRKEGRSSRYQLSDMGRIERDRAATRIYGKQDPGAGNIALIVAPPDRAACLSGLLSKGAVLLGPRTVLANIPARHVAPDCLVAPLGPGTLPDWVRMQLVSEDLRGEYLGLSKCVEHILNRPVPADLLARTSLRILILHQWRRLQLRHSEIADAVLPADWEGAVARAQVKTALSRLPVPPLETLAEAAQDRLRRG